jgi:16S rRNA (guanine527-N7)-methyltransferase
MFHVKHPRKSSAQQPDRIARTAIELVEQTLREIGFVPENRDLWVRIERFAAALALWGGRTNLTAAPNDSEELAFHIIDSLAPLIVAGRPEGSILRGAFRNGQRVLDLGSGAGFPGLILASATEAHFTLLEARRKRASFLSVAAAEMGLSNVEVDARRGQPGQQSSTFDVVTGRAYARPAIFYRAAGAALRPGGLAILYANPEQKLEVEATAESGLSGAGLIAYAIPRGSRKVERILSICRKR